MLFKLVLRFIKLHQSEYTGLACSWSVKWNQPFYLTKFANSSRCDFV